MLNCTIDIENKKDCTLDKLENYAMLLSVFVFLGTTVQIFLIIYRNEINEKLVNFAGNVFCSVIRWCV